MPAYVDQGRQPVVLVTFGTVVHDDGLLAAVLPVLPDQHWNGERAAATGSAIVVGAPADVAAAVTTVLTDPSYRDAAAATADRIAEMNAPGTALASLIEAATRGRVDDQG